MSATIHHLSDYRREPPAPADAVYVIDITPLVIAAAVMHLAMAWPWLAVGQALVPAARDSGHPAREPAA